MYYPGIGLPVLRTEASLALKIGQEKTEKGALEEKSDWALWAVGAGILRHKDWWLYIDNKGAWKKVMLTNETQIWRILEPRQKNRMN